MSTQAGGGRIKVGVQLHIAAHRAAELGCLVEAAGCESVWVPEHLIWPATLPNQYPYREGGAPPVDSLTSTHDPWVVLASVAACTTSLKLGTYLYILPLRDPFVSARAVGTLDTLSGGRVMLGAGVGWLRDEFEIVGRAWKGRGSRTEEIVSVLRSLWTGEVVSHDGPSHPFRPVRFSPAPPQGASLPVLLGGESEAALRRAARIGDGWLGMKHPPEVARVFVRQLHELLEEEGRDPAGFDCTVGSSSQIGPREVQQYAAAGVDRIIVKPWRRTGEDFDEVRAGLDRLQLLLASLG